MVLLILGRKGHRKGTDLVPMLLDPRAFPDAQLWMIGDEEPRERARLMAVHDDLAAAWGPRLRWMDAEEDPRPVLDQASVLLLPSRAEARPRVVEEALAHGVPAITSPIPGVLDISEMVTHPGALTVASLDEPWNEAIRDALRLNLPRAPLIAPFSETEFADAWLRVLEEPTPCRSAGLLD
jgi:glycosyltransferase involved in cell wall biosynthesis